MRKYIWRLLLANSQGVRKIFEVDHEENRLGFLANRAD
jgi:hypothetical protein